MRLLDEIHELMEELRVSPRPEFDTKVHDDISKTVDELKKTAPAAHPLAIQITITRSTITKLAAAAVIIMAVLAGVHQFAGPDVALADVLESVEHVQAFMYKMKMTVTGRITEGTPARDMEQIGTNIISTHYGMKMETKMTDPNSGEQTTQQIYVLPEQKAMFMIMLEQERYARMEFDDNLLAKMKKQSNDPREMIKQILNCRCTELGPWVIDGVKVEGFQTTDPAFYGGAMGQSVKVSLWVDVETRLPVLTEVDLRMDEHTHVRGVIYDYRWDIQVDETQFEPVIPENFEPFLTNDSIKAPSPSEEGAVEGLNLFVEFTGKYPEDIDRVTLMQQVDELRDTVSATAHRFREKLRWAGSEEKRMKILIEVMQPVQSLRMFYATLLQDGNDPAYYGDKVTPEFPHAVLMRWSVEDGNYRVILGDLTVAEVTADELAELESAPLNPLPKAIKPQPADGAAASAVAQVELSWMPGAYVNEHRVYFGTAKDQLLLLAEVTDSCSVTAPALEKATTYYWRVDEVQPDGSVATGDLWTFNTGKLVGWWKFDGDANDSSGNGNHGTVYGNPNWVTGRTGGALQFDGIDDCVRTDYTTDLPAWTVALWVNSPATPSSARSATAGPPVHRENNFQINWNHSVSDFCGGAALRVGNKWYAASFGELEANRWYHLAATYDGENLKAYKNGVLVTDNPRPSGPPDGESTTLKFARHSNYEEDCFEGTLDDVRIYSYDLRADELAAIYAAGVREE